MSTYGKDASKFDGDEYINNVELVATELSKFLMLVNKDMVLPIPKSNIISAAAKKVDLNY